MCAEKTGRIVKKTNLGDALSWPAAAAGEAMGAGRREEQARHTHTSASPPRQTLSRAGFPLQPSQGSCCLPVQLRRKEAGVAQQRLKLVTANRFTQASLV